ncbi:MAG: M16 family metallopeptidase [Vulcanimicrobiaceae bacterium]
MKPFVTAGLICAVALSVGGTSLATPQYPVAVVQQTGGIPIYVESDRNALLTGVQLFVPAGLDREAPNTSGAAPLVLECVLRTPVMLAGRRMPLREAIADAGGSIDGAVEGRWTRFYLEGRVTEMPAIVGLLQQALAAPDLSGQTLSSARAALLQSVMQSQQNPISVAVEMFRRSYYLGGNGLPDFGSAAIVARLGKPELQAFFTQNYLRGGTRVVTIGNADADVATAVGKLIQTLPAGTPAVVQAQTRPFDPRPARIIARRDVGDPLLVVGFAAPSPGNRDFAAMLVINTVITTGLEHSRTTQSLLPNSIGSYYLYDTAPASLAVYVNGSRVDPTLGLREVLTVATTLGDRPMVDKTLDKFKAIARGKLLMSSSRYGDRAYLIGTLARDGNDPLNAVMASLDRVTPADIQRVAKKYLESYTIAIVLPRNTGGE